MVKKIFFLLGLCILICFGMHAQVVSLETAQRVAENFFNLQSSSNSQVPIQVRTLGNRELTTLYVFSLSNRWVIIAGDKRMQPILAYSDDNGVAFPSAKEMIENGVSMCELQLQLLQKIEERTLYILQQEQRIHELESLLIK